MLIDTRHAPSSVLGTNDSAAEKTLITTFGFNVVVILANETRSLIRCSLTIFRRSTVGTNDAAIDCANADQEHIILGLRKYTCIGLHLRI